MAAPNIVNVTTITGKTAVQVAGTSAAAIVSNSAGSNQVIKVNTIMAGNVDTATAYDLTVDVFRSSVAYRFVSTVSISAKATLDVMSKALYLEEGDTLRITASAASKIEVVVSYEVIS